MSFRIAVDTGGTFSDVVVANDSSGELWINKAATTPERIFDGVAEALQVEAASHDLSLEELLNETELFVYGTTHTTNAILTGSTAKTAFITTAGHPDTLVLREGGKLNPFDFRHTYPEPYIPKHLTFEIEERIDAEGNVVVALNEELVAAIIADLKHLEIEAVSVCLLWSIMNPIHEQRIGELLSVQLPNVPFTLSHALNPIIREYRRASSASIDASLKPLMQVHLHQMENDLREAGLGGELLVGTSFGGVLTADQVADRPIYSVNSAPAMAPIAGRAYAGSDEAGVIICDMGGTSFDVSLIRDGYIKFSRETWLGEQYTGHMTGLSAVDVKNIGAGGGSIAWIDPGGLLRAGPQSAGADPGPACYGKGGTKPTVTDAAVVLGYIDPKYFLAGRIHLSSESAREAIQKEIAEPLNMSVEQAAHAILTLANEHMVSAISDITINEGIDPRESLIVAGGGAGGMTIGRIADTLGCERVLVPRTAGTLSACGGLFSNIVSEFSASKRTDTNEFDFEGINNTLLSLGEEMNEFFERLKTPTDQRRREFFVEARYPYQAWELEVPINFDQVKGESEVEHLVESFHAAHERVFGVSEPGQHVECIYWKARATAMLPESPLDLVSEKGSADRESWTSPAWFGDETAEDTSRHHGSMLTHGDRITGPSVIQEPTTTVVVYPGWSAVVNEHGDYMMEREAPKEVR
ncbi:MAG: hydantoinase/oxoprolinase family protein [Thermoleophilia bacterium]|nr:hydantoinase/oxoprolinase family protein [Thermoleophilia bacterium]